MNNFNTMKNNVKRGMTLVEVIVASSVVLIVILGVLSLNQFLQYNWQKARIKSQLVGEEEASLELIKRELQQTDAGLVIGYPSAAASYSAISFPLPVDTNNDGFVDLTATVPPKIAWGQTVIYHTYTNLSTHKVELRRTLFTSRDNTLTTAQRNAQILDVVTNGLPTTTHYGVAESWNATTGTRALWSSDNIVFTMTPSTATFDAYTIDASRPLRSENVSFGSITLAPGAHTISFICKGKNTASGGYKIGIDSFSISPGGFPRETEEATVNSTGPAGVGACTNQDMSAYTKYSWSANRQRRYTANGAADFVKFNFNYDQCIETNFSSPLAKTNIAVEYSARTGGTGGGSLEGREVSGNSNVIARLGGCDQTWSASTQVGGAAISNQPLTVLAGNNGIYIRNVLLSSQLTCEGRAISIKVDNTQNPNPLIIDCASIMQRDQNTGGPNGVLSTLCQITFISAGGAGRSVTVAAHSSVQSDWIDMDDPSTPAVIENFDKSNDYLVTLHANIPVGTTNNISGWTKSDGSQQSYLLQDSNLNPVTDTDAATWTSPAQADILYIVPSMDVTYFSSGTYTSQIYDTGMDNPLYTTLTWDIAKNNYGQFAAGNLGADLVIKVRSDVSEAALLGNNNWGPATTVDTLSALTGILNIAALGGGNKRYFQFQLQFSAKPSPGLSDYVRSCVLQDITINWPGLNRMVDVSGYYTLDSDYGIFSVQVDDKDLIRGLKVELATSQKYLDGFITESLAVESEPRNNNK